MSVSSASSWRLGVTVVNVSVEVHQGFLPGGAMLSMLNVHENENTSVVAARAFSMWRGARLTRLVHGGQRDVLFKLKEGGDVFTFDPNRMFTPDGVKASLQGLGPFSDEAALAVGMFADFVLAQYGFERNDVIIALHNNSPSYSIASYMAGGPFEKDAAAVHYVPGSNPRNFFFVTLPKLYDALASDTVDMNVVLQAETNSTLTDDGSLSFYAALHDKPYVNVEAAAEGGSVGDQVICQMQMIEALSNVLHDLGLMRRTR